MIFSPRHGHAEHVTSLPQLLQARPFVHVKVSGGIRTILLLWHAAFMMMTPTFILIVATA